MTEISGIGKLNHDDHASIARAMKHIPLPRRKRGGQSVAAEAEFERAVTEWCQEIIRVAGTMDYKIGARDWCYVLEVAGSLTKGEFDAGEKLISACRKDGHLPVDICGIDNGRPTANLKYIDRTSVEEEAEDIIARMEEAYRDYNPISLWANQECFVQMAVEKMGIYSMFEKPTGEFDVPLVNIGGWSDINSRVAMMRRYAYWEARGKKCVLLPFVDHDPGGLHIANFLLKNLTDLSDAVGWSPDNLIIDRFGLEPRANYLLFESRTEGRARADSSNKHTRAIGGTTQATTFEQTTQPKYRRARWPKNLRPETMASLFKREAAAT